MEIPFLNFIYTLRTPELTAFMIIFTEIGREYLLFLLTVPWLIYFFLKKMWAPFFLFIFTFVLTQSVNEIIKILVHRPRPNISPLEVSINDSFPSGHAAGVFVFFMLVGYFLTTAVPHRKVLQFFIWTVVATIILMMGFSRLYLGMHYVTDVLGGFVEGAVILLLSFALARVKVRYK